MESGIEAHASAAAPGPRTLGHKEKLSIILGILVVMLLAALDQTIVAPAMPTIGRALGNEEYLPWVITAYLLTGTAVAPLYGSIADIHGRRQVIAAAIVIFVAGSVVAALSGNMAMLIAGRAIQGFGGGGLFVLAQTVIGDTVPPRERAAYAGYISAVWAIASIAGPVLGGVFAEHLSWSLIFWINIPLGIGALLALRGPLKKLDFTPRTHRLDYLGAALVLSATAPLMLALTWGGTTYPWSSFVILSLFGLSLALWCLLAVRLAHAAEPLIPIAVLRNGVVAAVTMAVFFGMAASVAIAVYMPIYLQSHLELSVAASGLTLMSYIVGTTLGAAVIGRLVSRLPRYKPLAVGGMLVAALCLSALAMLADTRSLLLVGTLLFVMGAGFGAMFPIGTVSVQNAVDYDNLGIATATLTFMRNLGSAIGVAVIGAVALMSGLPGIREGIGASDHMRDVATAVAFRHIFLAAAAIALIAALCFGAMKELRLRATIQGE